MKQFYVHVAMQRNSFLYNENNRRTNFQIYSGTQLYMFWDNFFAHHQEFSTVRSALAHVIQV
jgi:hypothetical protein